MIGVLLGEASLASRVAKSRLLATPATQACRKHISFWFSCVAAYSSVLPRVSDLALQSFWVSWCERSDGD